jgi:bile acid-coenzyme A ligase
MVALSLAEAPRRRSPERVALIYSHAQGEQVWTFGQLDLRAKQWRTWLEGRGVKADDLVAFAFPNGLEFFALTFGIYGAGATPAPVSHKLPERELGEILDIMQPATFVTPADVAAIEGATPTAAPVHVARSWKACTSGGSTGRPKVIVDGRPAAFDEKMDFIGIPADEVVLVPGPLYHNAPFSASVFALWKGDCVVTMDRFDPERALGLIEKHRASWAMMVPTMMHRIFRLSPDVRKKFDLSSWTMVVHTAAPIAQWLKHAWIDWLGPDHIWEVYGATEGLVRCWIGGRDWLQRPGSAGLPAGGARLKILRPDGAECEAGEQGEVYAMPSGGPGSSYRYIGAERRATADGWESVGDIGHVDADGYLFLADRRNDLIISGGVNIWPAEVEAAILAHPRIYSCAVLGAPDEDLGQRVHAVIETDDTLLDLAALRLFLSDLLVASKHPRSLVVTDKPVRDDAGKVRKATHVPNA